MRALAFTTVLFIWEARYSQRLQTPVCSKPYEYNVKVGLLNPVFTTLERTCQERTFSSAVWFLVSARVMLGPVCLYRWRLPFVSPSFAFMRLLKPRFDLGVLWIALALTTVPVEDTRIDATNIDVTILFPESFSTFTLISDLFKFAFFQPSSSVIRLSFLRISSIHFQVILLMNIKGNRVDL